MPTNFGDYFLSLIRTYVPIAVGGVISWLALRGIEVNDDTRLLAVTALTGLASAAYYTVARTLEAKWPILGRLLLGSSKIPSYQVPGDSSGHSVTRGQGDVPSTNGD